MAEEDAQRTIFQVEISAFSRLDDNGLVAQTSMEDVGHNSRHIVCDRLSFQCRISWSHGCIAVLTRSL